jgi:hypothetical protein
MKESEMFSDLNEKLSCFFDFEKIESGRTGTGIPDIFYSGLSCCGWIESKQKSGLKRTTNIEIPYRPGQQKWLNNKKKKGLNVYVLFYTHGKYFLLDDFRDSFPSIQEMETISLWVGKNLYSTKLISLLYNRMAP